MNMIIKYGVPKIARRVFMKHFISYIVFILILVNCFNLLGDDIQIVSKTQVFNFSQGSEIYTSKGVFRDLENTKMPFIMSSNFKTGDNEDEDIDTDSERRILTDGGLGCSFG